MQCWWWDGWRGSMAGKINKKKKIEAYYYCNMFKRLAVMHGWCECWIGCIFVLEVGWLERMHGRDTALNVDSCNATTMHSLRHQQFNFCSLFNLFKFFLSRVFLCFSIMLAFKYHSGFPVICVRQLKDKSLKVGIVGIIIR